MGRGEDGTSSEGFTYEKGFGEGEGKTIYKERLYVEERLGFPKKKGEKRHLARSSSCFLISAFSPVSLPVSFLTIVFCSSVFLLFLFPFHFSFSFFSSFIRSLFFLTFHFLSLVSPFHLVSFTTSPFPSILLIFHLFLQYPYLFIIFP